MRQQIAVEFLVELLPQIDWNDPYYRSILQEAKDMEKEQIIKAWETRATPYPMEGMGYSIIDATGEQYYNETYNK